MVTGIGSMAFDGCTGLYSLSIGNGVTTIGDYAFRGCTGLTSVTIPGSVKTVGTYAFSGCTGLTKITLNNGIEELKLRSLSGCKKLTSVTIPNSVKIIREKAFCDNTAVTSVNLGTGVTAIEYMAFANNNSLKTVTANSVVPPATSASYAFNGTTPARNSITLKFPIASYYAYSTAHEFEEFNFDFAIGTEQGPGGFSGSGAGTENDPYLIFNPIQLYNVRNFNGKAGVVFKLMADIDLTDFIADNNPNNGWEPIGTNSSPFMGKFYGDNHKISGLKISRTNDYIGLFGCTNGATINNLTVEGTTVSGGAYTGVVAGAAVNTTINNVTGNASVNGKSYVGGFAGLSHGSTLSKCYHTGTVTATDSIVGGFIGNIAKGTLTTGSHKGNVKGGLKTGGFAGNCLSSTVTTFTQSGTVSGGQYTGGFAGNCRLCTITGFTQTGDVSASSGIVGGFAGYLYNGIVKNSVFNGSVSAPNYQYVGGFCGSAEGDAISNCSFTNCKAINGNITGGYRVGGFMGQTIKATITNCYAENNVTATSKTIYPNTGGFIGRNAHILSISNSGSVGNVTSQDYNDNGVSNAGGFVGTSIGGLLTMTNCYAIGDVSGTGNRCGGLVGNSDGDLSISNSYYSGDINGVNNVGGIVGNAVANTTISKCYASGSINSTQNTGGIAGNITAGEITSCVASQNSINAASGSVGRIYGVAGSGVVIGENGTNTGNQALESMNVVSQGSSLTINDNAQHGTSLGKLMLKYISSYQGKGWDFSTDWTIQETESYPYKPSQCAPPVFTGTLTSGMTTVTGKCASGAEVYAVVEGKEYKANVSGSTWTATVPALKSGITVRAYAKTSTLMHSYYNSSIVGFAGSGTENDPYRIYTAEDLANINSYAYYKVMNDIDLTDWINTNNKTGGWKPVGINGGGTMKQLDGSNHTISGLWVNSTLDNVGLVSSIENATIKDITVKIATGKSIATTKGHAGVVVGKAMNSVISNCKVTAGKLSATESNVGGVAGYATGSTFTDCNVEGVTATCGGANVGGICGYTESDTFNNCALTESSFTGTGNYAGGIASGSKSNNNFEKCVVSNSTIGGQSYVGGITGSLSTNISELTVDGSTIKGTGNHIGGIVGNTSKLINMCSANVTLTGALNLGGIAGNATAAITLCTSEGTIKSTDMATSKVGGIAGNTTAAISNCYSTASVSGGQYVGGIAGYTTNSIDKCYASGNLASKYFAGGVVGYMDGANAKTNYCFAMCTKIDVEDQTGTAMRVIGGFKNGALTPAATNYALKSMVVSVNGVTQTIYDDVLEGKGVQLATLKQQPTYTAQGWDFNETWGINEGEGFPYLQWTAVEPEPEYVTGDANGDGFVRINDVVTTSNYILGDEPAGFVFAAADVNQDGFVRINDVVLIANIILDGGMNAPAKVAVMQLAGNDYMTAQGVEIKAGETRFIDIELNNDNAFSALQMDINLPDGLMLKGATLTGRADGHNLMTGRTVNGKATIAVISTESNNFAGNNGAVIRLEVMATGNVTEDIMLDNIFASTAKGVLKQLDAVSVGVNAVSGINDITVGNGLVNVYNTAGQLVRRNANASEATRNLPAGLYLVGGKKVVVK
ncbi:leucine-rich repeat protein [Sodaliphilus sp.]|uniref:leucine-rich repeat protein n=1 Tax=Sodaliphilus sp. TaxID=2815818 RepID=UPI00388EB8B2